MELDDKVATLQEQDTDNSHSSKMLQTSFEDVVVSSPWILEGEA